MTYPITIRLWSSVLAAALLLSTRASADPATLDADFNAPPAAARPYVWWHWMGTNISPEGISLDLAAMKQMDVAGATVCAVSSTADSGRGNATIANSPWPAALYLSPAWWSLMQQAVAQGGKLGFDMGMHNCAGWSASGGPWITPELSMQKVVWSETPAAGPAHFAAPLPQPAVDARWNFYRDIAVLAVPAGQAPPASSVVDLTKNITSDGSLAWDVPAGNWTIYRFGHTTTGSKPHPMPDGFDALECDKLSAAAATLHIQHVLDAIRQNLGPLEGTTFQHILFDSYEAGPQNWTEDFRPQFLALRGYDPVPWLPVLAGRTLGGPALAARFQWDLKQTISDLFVKNNFAVFHKLIDAAGLRMDFEPYTGPFDTIDATAECNLPMGEFWSDGNDGITKYGVAQAAQALGQPVVGAESFTGKPTYSEWSEDPAFLKAAADGALISGVNQFYLHDWTLQPFPDTIKPGVAMGWWGTHFGRNQTWFLQGKAWFDYLARSSALLQHGSVVSDYCTLEFTRFGADALSDQLLFDATVQDHQIVLTTGRKYALLVLPDSPQMLPAVALKIQQLVSAGAAVLGPKPVSSPSLQDYPASDANVSLTGNNVWGPADGVTVFEHDYGLGKVFSGQSVTEVLAALGLGPDFSSALQPDGDVRFIHRRDADADIYFIANFSRQRVSCTVSFRITSKVPELWYPDSGHKLISGEWSQIDDRTSLPLTLGPQGSVFVIFRQPSTGVEQVLDVHHQFADVNPADASLTPPLPPRLRLDANGQLHLRTNDPGVYLLPFASGNSQRVDIPAWPAPHQLTGPWDVDFTPGWGAPASATFDTLTPWNDSAKPGIKYFSGTGTYNKDVEIPRAFLQPNLHVMLDLGDVKTIAQVFVNGHDLGVLWHPPYVVDITDAVKLGANHLAIAVTNDWRNRLIGDEQLPADATWNKVQTFRDWNIDHTKRDQNVPVGAPLLAFPDWIVQGQPQPQAGRYTFTTWNYFTKDSPLAVSGLLGPVTVRGEADVPVPSP